MKRLSVFKFNQPTLKRMVSVFGILFSLVLVIGIYSPSLNAPFIWDDEAYIVENPFIRSVSNSVQVFNHGSFGDPLSKGVFYRPIQILSYRMDYQLFGLNPLGYRSVNLGIHCLNGLLLWILLRKLRFNGVVAALAALMLLVHPFAIEGVTYISGRGDILCVTGLLAAYLSYIGAIQGRWAIGTILTVFFYTVSILTKENGIFFPVFLMVHHRLFLNATAKAKSRWTIGALVAVMVGYFIFKFGLLPGSTNTVLSHIASADLGWRIWTVWYMVWTYFRLFWVPYPLHMEYHYVETSIWTPYLLLTGGVLLVGWGMARILQHRQLVLWWLAWILIFFLPVSQVVMPLASTVREHWAYLPSIGGFVWLASVVYTALQRHSKYRLWILGAMTLYLTSLSVLGVIRTLDWRDPLTFYQHDVRLEPKSFILHNNLGVVYFRQGDMAYAERSFEKSIVTSPHKSYAEAYNNLGVIKERKGQLKLAKALYMKSIEFKNYRLAYINLIQLFYRLNQPQLAKFWLKKAQDHYPNDPEFDAMNQVLEGKLKKSS